jgi:hypothetical protein
MGFMIRELSLVVFFIWAVGFPLAVFVGICASDHRRCEAPAARYEYIFPGFQLGCWLGEIP